LPYWLANQQAKHFVGGYIVAIAQRINNSVA
jgi:hypothetical protein